MVILGIDPGTTESAYVLWDAGMERVIGRSIESNAGLAKLLRGTDLYDRRSLLLAIEMIASYGMPVGAETFETCLWIGRFLEAHHDDETATLIYRRDVKLHLCNSARAKDGNVRQAIIDRFGGKEKAIGKKAAPGPLYGITSHCWPALAVCLTAADRVKP